MALQITAPFEVEKNKQYYIVEKTTDETDDALRKENRSKKLAYAFETAGCPYDEYNNKYDTGLDEYSREFIGVDPAEIKSILKKRKPLIDTLSKLTRGDDSKEAEEIAKLRTKVYHEMAINTSNPMDYLRLYFLMRSSVVTPPTETNNFAKYGSSMYVLVDRETNKSNKDKHAKMIYKVISYLTLKLESDKQVAFELLRYVNLLGPTEEKEPSYLLETVHTLLHNDYKTLEKMATVIDEVDEQERRAYSKVAHKYAIGKIKKEMDGFYFNDNFLGLDLKSVAKKLINDKSKEGKTLLMSIVDAE